MNWMEHEAGLDLAIAIASISFLGKFDKGGNPYILHCLFVMNEVKYTNDEDVMIAAVLHDLIEDTDWTTDDLLDLGFSEKVVVLLNRLTHWPEDSYDKYLDGMKGTPDAVKIKLADLKHNSMITRMKGLREKDFKRLEKYCRAYSMLKEWL